MEEMLRRAGRCGWTVMQGAEVRHEVSFVAQKMDSWGGPADWTISGTVDKVTGSDDYSAVWTEREDGYVVKEGYAEVCWAQGYTCIWERIY